MLDLTFHTHWLGEVLRPDSRLLSSGLIQFYYQFVDEDLGPNLYRELSRILSFNYTSLERKYSFRRFLPSRLWVYRLTARYVGLPRPLLKDPFTALSADWLAHAFDMEVVYLIRHPAAVVDSLKRVGWHFDFEQLLKQKQLMDKWLYPFARQLEQPPTDIVEGGALLWLLLHYVLTAYHDRNPHWHAIRLEDLSRHPLAQYEDLYHKLGLPYTGLVRKKIWETSNPSNAVQPPAGELHHINRDSRRVIEQWRHHLSPQEILGVRKIVEPFSDRYYSADEW